MALTVRLFPLLAAGMALAAYLWPQIFTPGREAITPLLGVVMFGMGLTLTPADFSRVIMRPRSVAIGIALQFLLMPFGAWVLAYAFALPPELAAGLILVGACPGGTASNVVTYLARGDVALSVTITACTTLLSVVMTPALTWVYAGAVVPVPVAPMLLSIVYVIAVPVAAGVVLRLWLPQLARRFAPALPMISVGAIVVIIAIVVALNRGQMTGAAAAVAAAVVLHNLSGLAAGYGLARFFNLSETDARAVAIEVGMQNSGLGVALAIQYFSAQAALPGAIFSIWHNLSGAGLASFWSRRPIAQATDISA